MITKRQEEFDEEIELMIYLLGLCNNVTHAQKVFNSWQSWKHPERKVS